MKRTYLEELREKRQASMTEMAYRMGVTETSYRLIENGIRQTDMRMSMLERLADAYGLSFEQMARLERKYRKECQSA